MLSVLAAINVQTHSDINLGGQGIVTTNQGVASQPCFQQAKHMQYGTKHASKGEIELAVLKAFW